MFDESAARADAESDEKVGLANDVLSVLSDQEALRLSGMYGDLLRKLSSLREEGETVVDVVSRLLAESKVFRTLLSIIQDPDGFPSED